MLRIAFITARTPWGRGETFVLDEMLAVKETGADLVVIPRNPAKEVFHQEAQPLVSNAVWLPLVTPRMIGIFLISLLTKSRLWRVLGSILHHSRTWGILIKNLAMAPKGIFIAELLKKEGVEHIHAHWGSTTGTMAYIASQLIGIPWSFTLHRWDIAENNMLREKVKTAEFARCISRAGRKETFQIVGSEFADKIKLIHMGVKVPYSSAVPSSDSTRERSSFTIVCPANFIEVKGHRFLVKACSLLVKKGITNFQCLLFGEGPLAGKIRDMIQKLDLEEYVKMPGSIPHEKLMQMYKNREIDIVILPSINTDRGDKEGIPVALMEALAYRIPVVSTDTGGIPELLSDGVGVMVQEKDSEQLANALEKLMKDGALRKRITCRGYERVKEQFEVHENVAQLLELMAI